MARMSRADALHHLGVHAADIIREENVDAERLGPAGTRHLMNLAGRRLNRAARRALGGRGDGRHHPLAGGMHVPKTRGR